jgi:transcriptional regulator with XRE-family HTH domain
MTESGNGTRQNGDGVDAHVGERIRKRRTELGLTQEELGSGLGISYQQIQKYETGANRISAGRLFEIATALDIGIAYFFENFSPGKRDGGIPHGGHNRTAIELVRNFQDIGDESLRSAVAALLKALKDSNASARPR